MNVKPGRKAYPIETLLSSKITGLPKDSIAMAHQIRAISKERVGCGSIASEEVQEQIRNTIRIYVDL